MAGNNSRAVTRFAPAPTGSLHIGGARTALFNYLWAKHTDGKFILRFEDTDKSRSSEENERAILRDLLWLGIRPDEPAIRQTDNSERHSAVLDELISGGFVYPCFCAAAEYAGEKRISGAHRCRELAGDEASLKISGGEPHCFRFKTDSDRDFSFTDRLRGEMTAKAGSVEDFAVARSDRSVMYLLAAVIDDHDEGVSCVIRGEEHLSNIPKQEMIYDALGWEKPEWVHIPMILDSDRHKLSKRTGATSITEYRNIGWSPEALISYLATMSWSGAPTDKIAALDELAGIFELDDVARFSPVHDEKRMAHFGNLYLAGLGDEYLAEACGTVFEKLADENADETDKKQLLREMRPACQTVLELAQSIENELTYGKPESAEPAPAWLPELKRRLASLPDHEWRAPNIMETIKSFGSGIGLKGRELYHPVRLFTTGNSHGAPIGVILSCAGKKETLARLDKFV